MKTIEVRSRWNLEDWDYYLRMTGTYGNITDLEAGRAALEQFKHIMLRERMEVDRVHVGQFVGQTWIYTVPEYPWTLLVLTWPVVLQLFEVVNDENN